MDSNIVTVNITVNPVNDAPVAVNDSYNTNEDTVLNVSSPGVLSNDTDVDGDTLKAIKVTNPSHGSLTLNADGSFSYTPNLNYNGSDSFTYKANDGKLDSNIVTVNITVNPVNDAPVAVNDSYNTNEDTVLNISSPGVLSNDTDVDGDTLKAIKVTDPSHGSLTLNADGSFSYTPNLNYNGSDSFTYKANDSKLDSNIATVNITVNPVNDAPVAVNDSYNTNEDTVLNVSSPGVLSNDTDVDGDTLKAIKVTDPSHGSLTLNADGSFSYTPNLNYNGSDSFTYKANDSKLDSNIATVSITVLGGNPPVAVNDSYNMNEDTVLNVSSPGVLSNDTDVDGDTLKAIKVTNPSHGSLTLNADGSFSYTPNLNYNGSDSFTYKANDSKLDSNIATVNITVNPVNDAPVAVNDSYNTNEDTVLNVSSPGVLSNDTDVDGDTLKAIKVTDPSHGSLTLNADGSFSYTPNLNYNGSDSFTYKANDSKLDSNIATVSITVLGGNPPVAVNDSYNTNEDTVLNISSPGVLSNDTDVDGDTLKAIKVTDPSHGSLTLNADGSFSYTPNLNYNGSDSFTYKANDSKLDSNIATVNIKIIPNIDVTALCQIDKFNSIFERASGNFSMDMTIKNNSLDKIFIRPIKLFVKNINPLTIPVVNADGIEDGNPYFDYSDFIGSDKKLIPGELSSAKRIIFKNPSRLRFTFDITVMAILDSGSIAAPSLLSQTNTVIRIIIPGQSVLLQNYPNPFNPETWMPYELLESADVTIKIYDLTGKLIKSLELGYREVGAYLSKNDAAYWNGKNEMGEKVASGIYFYQIKAGNFVSTRKFVMLK